ncbi:MAG: NUDIX domain-containing protein [Bacilli bacterium]|nr:NUDIX domain-containing protein [Bacilli bacterium]
MEILNIYNDNHELLGTCEKKLAHKLGMWHEVFTCLVFNPEKNTVFFQIKNHSHNNIHEKDLIEITVGGHYQAGENLEDGIRELEEETGLKVKFKDLVNLGIRQVATTPTPTYVIREFQNIFLCPIKGNLASFKNFDSNEVSEFIEFNIDELINLLLKRSDKIVGSTQSGNREVNLTNFVESFLSGDKLYLRLLIATKRYINKEDLELIFW